MKPALSLVDPEDDLASASDHACAAAVIHVSPRRPAQQWRWIAADQSAVQRAITIAREILPKWRATRTDERLRLLQSFGAALESRHEELAQLLIDEVGKPIRYARGEVTRAIALIKASAQQIDRGQDLVPSETGYRREPLGVIGLISPFNNPLAIPVGKFVPALLYGNVVVWKPALPGTAVALRIVEVFAEATQQPELLQVLCGGEETAHLVMQACDAVTISGSLNAGRVAQEICAARHIPLQAELGGNNASVVWGDTDLALAAASIAEGAFAFAGQRCTANRRVILDSKIYDRFLDELFTATSHLVWGGLENERTQVGPVISLASRERVARVVDRAEKSGLRVVRPLNSQRVEGEAWLAPAIVCCDEPAQEIVQEETFGPVLVVQRAKDWNDAISLCNGVKQGLAAALFSKSQSLIEDFLRRAKAGILKINCSTADAAVDLPFGGWKSSGIGPAEHGPANREFFTRMQAVYFS